MRGLSSSSSRTGSQSIRLAVIRDYAALYPRSANSQDFLETEVVNSQYLSYP